MPASDLEAAVAAVIESRSKFDEAARKADETYAAAAAAADVKAAAAGQLTADVDNAATLLNALRP